MDVTDVDDDDGDLWTCTVREVVENIRAALRPGDYDEALAIAVSYLMRD